MRLCKQSGPLWAAAEWPVPAMPRMRSAAVWAAAVPASAAPPLLLPGCEGAPAGWLAGRLRPASCAARGAPLLALHWAESGSR
jgi:hypothetical protein